MNKKTSNYKIGILKILVLVGVIMTGIVVFVFVLAYDYFFLTEEQKCNKLIQTQKSYYTIANDEQRKRSWDLFNYYWDLDFYNCSQFHDKDQVINEILQTG